jgi:hypothetical protein
MDIGSGLQQAMIDRAAGYIALVWIVAAIMVGLVASETKRRRFWTWVLLSLATGPIAWYWLLFRTTIAVPKELAVECPHCHKQTRSDLKTCVHCRLLITPKDEDKATQLGKTAATWLFAARKIATGAAKAADQVQQQRRAARPKTPER